MGETVLKESASAKSSASPSCLAQKLGSSSSACNSAWLSSRGERCGVMGNGMQSGVEEMSMFLLEWQLLIYILKRAVEGFLQCPVSPQLLVPHLKD